jgi:hypothetical protein
MANLMTGRTEFCSDRTITAPAGFQALGFGEDGRLDHACASVEEAPARPLNERPALISSRDPRRAAIGERRRSAIYGLGAEFKIVDVGCVAR